MDKSNNVAYMTNYLGYAFEFEKNSYIWQQAFSAINDKLYELESQKNEIIQQYNISRKKIDPLLIPNRKNFSNSTRWQITIEEENLKNYKAAIIVIKQSQSYLMNERENIKKYFAENQQYLNKLYSFQVLPQKYRNLTAVGTMLEYLLTGRCTCIKGFGGIYSTYEDDVWKQQVLESLNEILNTLDRIESTMNCIFHEMQTTNSILRSINYSVQNIEKSSRETAHNTAISAAYDKQTAAATSYMAGVAYMNYMRQ